MTSEANSGRSESNQNKYLHIPSLVKKSYIDNPKAATDGISARQQLLDIVREDQYLDPTFFVVSEIQKQILASSKHKTKQWINIMEEIIAAGVDTHEDKNDPERKIKFHNNHSVRLSTDSIIKQDNLLKQQNIFEHHSAPHYEDFMTFVSSAKKLFEESSPGEEDFKKMSSERWEEMGNIFWERMKSILESSAGEEFLSKFAINSKEINQITQTTWKDAINKIHYLPMKQGENIIEFSEESVPGIIGIKSLSMNRLGSDRDWQMRVAYLLNNNLPISLILDRDGRINFHNFPPKHAALLNHIAVLAFHDLVIQEQGGKATESPKVPPEKNGESDPNENHKNESKDLPRIQRDKDLILDVYKITEFTPRRVELHKSTLPGAKEYKAVVDLYNEAIKTNTQIDMVGWIKEELETARKKAHKISPSKKISVPEKFNLNKITDPITGAEYHLETWVVEHTSPKPTEEELKSPIKMFERYYKKSSALASLDQMKPWFVGQ